MLKEPLVSIIMPVYNANKYLSGSIESALNQSYNNTELIIIDDGSTDNSLSIAKQYNSRKIKIINQKNNGATSARNKGLSIARGDFIQFLDSDDLLSPNKIEVQIKRLIKYNNATIATCPWYKFEASLNHCVPHFDRGFRDFKEPLEWLILSAKFQSCFYTHVWLTPKNLIEEAGNWDESLKNNPIDDTEFFSRVLERAENLVFCSNTTVYYRIASNGNYLSRQRNYPAAYSRLTTYQRISKILISYRNDDETRSACGKMFSYFIYSNYPYFPGLTKLAERELGKLRVKMNLEFGSGLSFRLQKYIGWKITKRIKQVYIKILFYFKKILFKFYAKS